MGCNLSTRFGGVLALLLMFGAVAPAQAFNANWVDCLGGMECSQCNTTPDLKNPWGYLGFYQMGVNYASEAICTSSSRANIPLMNVNQNWTLFEEECELTPWAISQGITSHDDWMRGGNPPNPARAKQLQQAMLLKNSEALWTRIQNELGQYIGQTVNGVVMDKETMVAMAHLKGFGGLRQTVQNGDSNVTDGNGTSTVNYAACLQSCIQNNGEKGDCKATVPNICKD